MFAAPIQDLIDELARLPGIGPKSAQRVAVYLLKSSPAEAHRLAKAVTEAKEKVMLCRICFNFSDAELCGYCSDPRRDPSVICVVQDAPDIVAIERTREYRGLYHVLHGAINHLEGIGADQLKIRELLRRLADEPVKEVILCTNPNLEGDATALYLSRLLHDTDLVVTRLASGLPVGSDLEYADELTLGRALDGRRALP